VQQALAKEMEHGGRESTLEFERAAAVRDRIRALTHVQGTDVHQSREPGGRRRDRGLADGGAELRAGVLHSPAGATTAIGHSFPAHGKADEAPDVLAAFISRSSTTTSRRHR
jgi:excinuclease ABC subunit C